jgi:hypothetical protein
MLRTENRPALKERLFTFEVRIAEFSVSVTVKFAFTEGTVSRKPNNSSNQVMGSEVTEPLRLSNEKQMNVRHFMGLDRRRSQSGPNE